MKKGILKYLPIPFLLLVFLFCAVVSCNDLAEDIKKDAVPEISVLFGDTIISSGDIVEIGSAVIDSTVEITFTIENLQGGDLNLTGENRITFIGTDEIHFVVVLQPDAVIDGYRSSSFTIEFSPLNSGEKEVTVIIQNNDQDEGAFLFTLTGTGLDVPLPEIGITIGDTPVASGGSYDFGTVISDGDLGEYYSEFTTFSIENTGSAELAITNISKYSGDIDDFDLENTASSTVAPGESSGFSVRFDPLSEGSKEFVLSISNNDSNENPFTITLTGTAVNLSGTPVMGWVTSDSTYNSDKQFTLTAVDAQTIYYTLSSENGSPPSDPPDPTSSSNLYEGPVDLTAEAGEIVYYRIKAVSLNSVGDPSDIGGPWSVIIDREPPEVPVLGGVVSGETYSADQSFSLSSAGGSAIYYVVSSNTGSEAPEPDTPTESSSLYNGPVDLSAQTGDIKFFRIKAVAYDDVGNASGTGGTWSVVIDKQPPLTPVITGVTSGAVYSTDQSFSLSADGSVGVYYSMTSDTGTAPADPPDPDSDSILYENSVDLTASNDQTVYYKIKAIAYDEFDNTGSVGGIWTVTIDKESPLVPSVGGITSGTRYAEDMQVSLTAVGSDYIYYSLRSDIGSEPPDPTDPTSSYSEFNDYIDFSANSGETVYYKLKAVAYDAAGNMSDIGGSWTAVIDKEAPAEPEIDGIASGETYAANQNFTLTSEGSDDGSIHYAMTSDVGTLPEDPGDPTSASTTYSGAVSLSATTGQTVYYKIKAVAYDEVENESDIGGIWTAVIDKEIPVGYSVSFDQDYAVNVNETEISFTFTGAETGTDYSWSVDDAANAGTDPVTGSGAVTSSGQTVTGLDVSSLDDSILTLTVSLTDGVGNTGGDVTDTILKETVPPSGYGVTIDGAAVNDANKDSVEFTFSGAETGTAYHYSFDDSDNPGTIPIEGSGTVTASDEQITGIDVSSLNDGTLTLTVVLMDEKGNIGSDAVDTVEKDASLPEFISVDDGGGDNSYIPGETITLDVDMEEAGLAVSADLAVLDDLFSSVQTMTDDGDGTYSFTTGALNYDTMAENTGIVVEITAVDGFGNTTVDDSLTFILDKTPPPVPTISGITSGTNYGTDQSVTLISAGADYIYYELASAVGSAPSDPSDPTSASSLYSSVLGLTASSGQTVFFKLKAVAYDEYGNASETGGIWSSTVDKQAPSVGGSGVITSGGDNDDYFSIIWTKGSDIITAQAGLQYKVLRSGSGNIGSVSTAESYGTTVLDWTADKDRIRITGLSAHSTYYVNILVRDEFGNKAIYTMTSHYLDPEFSWTDPQWVYGNSTYEGVDVVLIYYLNNLYAVIDESYYGRYVRAVRYNGTSHPWTVVDGGSGLQYSTGGLESIGRPLVIGSNLYATWTESNSGWWQVRVMQYNGSSWSFIDGGGATGLNYDTGTHGYGPPSLGTDGVSLYAAWYEYNGSKYQIRVKKYDGSSWSFVDGGGTTGINVNTSQNAVRPVMILFNARLHIFWYESDGSRYQIRGKRYDSGSWLSVDGGSSQNYSSSYSATLPKLAVYNSKLYVTWYESNGTADQVRVKSYDGSSWSFVDGGGSSGLNYDSSCHGRYPVLTDHNGYLYTVWSEEDSGGEEQVRVKQYDGSSWTFVDGGGPISALNNSISGNVGYVSADSYDSKLWIGWGESSKAYVRSGITAP